MRDDGLIDLEAQLTDLKDIDYPLSSGLRKVGEPVHDLFIRVTVDREFTIVDVEGTMLRVRPATKPGGVWQRRQ